MIIALTPEQYATFCHFGPANSSKGAVWLLAELTLQFLSMLITLC
uniref:Uncharacterized protein n=1 Tax=Rhizophora mucronata TaxID=61149 RepID=A0A2P2N2W4_RHIMU